MRKVDKLEGQFCECVSSFFSMDKSLGSEFAIFSGENMTQWHQRAGEKCQTYRKDSKVLGERQEGYLEGSKSRASLT